MSGYRFPAWARETIGSDQPAEVRRWFSERGLDLTRETWRKFLRDGAPPSFLVTTWQDICEASKESFSRFFDYQPSDRPPVVRRRPAPRRSGRAAARPSIPPPPSPRDFFGGRDAS